MTAFPPPNQTWMISLECLGSLPGNRFLDGRTDANSVGLAPNSEPPFTGTSWAVTTLAPNLVKFRCMGFAQAHSGPTHRFLDGDTQHGTIGLQPMLALPPSGEWWRFTELADGSVTLECAGSSPNPNFRFLDGHTPQATVGLAPNTSPPFTGTRWRVHVLGTLVALECQGSAPGNRFLDGNSGDNKVDLAPMALGRFTGTHWLLQNVGGTTVRLKSMGLIEGNRFLDGHTADRSVRLAPNAGTAFPGTSWQMTAVPSPHADVELGFLATFRCLGGPETGFRFLDGITNENRPSLAPNTNPPFTGTLWRVLPAFPYFEPCTRFGNLNAPTSSTVHVTRTRWVGQLTGSVQPGGRALINGNTAVLGVPGVDLGTTTEDDHGRLFIFSGDVVRGLRSDGPPVDADMVAFTVDGAVTELPDEGGGGIRLNIVMKDRNFDPFFVDGGIGFTETFEVPNGAYAHNGRVFVFFNVRDDTSRRPPLPKGCYIASKANPERPGHFSKVGLFSPQNGAGPECFGGVAPVKIRNADHAWLPPHAASLATEGLVLFGIGESPSLGGYSAVHLAWMPLTGDMPDVSAVRYFTNLAPAWSPQAASSLPLFGKAPNLQSVSAAYLEGPNKWIVCHMTADDSKRMTGPVFARIGTPPHDWSAPINLFDPCREGAYGRYMHWPDLDGIQLADPFRAPPPPDLRTLEQMRADAKPGWAYGAFLLKRYTRWNAATRDLDLYYLLSFGSPYQIQLMHTTLKFVHPTL